MSRILTWTTIIVIITGIHTSAQIDDESKEIVDENYSWLKQNYYNVFSDYRNDKETPDVRKSLNKLIKNRRLNCEDTTKKNPECPTSEELKSELVHQDHADRLAYIKDFLTDEEMPTIHYVKEEIDRIRKTGIIKDDLRKMVRVLDKPKFSKIRDKVVECYHILKSKKDLELHV